MNLSLRLKEERERLGLSQTAFAALAGASKHAQINWEKGVASPNAEALAAWSENGLDVLYVVTGKRSVDAGNVLTPSQAKWAALSPADQAVIETLIARLSVKHGG